MNFTIKNKIRWIAAAILMIFIIGCIIAINHIFPGPTIQTTEAGDVLSYYGLEYRMTDWQLLTYPDYLSQQDRLDKDGLCAIDESLQDSYCLVYVELEVTNPSEETLPVAVPAFDCLAYGNNPRGAFSDDGIGISDIGAGSREQIHYLYHIKIGFIDDIDVDAARLIFCRDRVQKEMKIE